MESSLLVFLLRLLQVEVVAYLIVFFVLRNKLQKVWLARALYGLSLAMLITVGMLFYAAYGLEGVKN